MGSRIIWSIFLIIVLGTLVSSVFAREIRDSQTSNIPTPLIASSTADREATIYRQQQIQISTVLLYASLIASLIIGIILMIYMIKKSPKIPNLIIHGLVLLGSAIWFISMIFGLLFQLLTFGSIPDPDIIEIGWPSIFLLIFSSYFTINLIKKENFAKKMRHSLNLFSGGIITTVLAFLSTITIGIVFEIDGLAVGLMSVLVFMVGAIGSFILGIIGFIIDKYENKYSRKL